MIWLLRHGDAEAGSGDDVSRRLTSKGEKQSRWAGKALAALGVEIEACISSPKVRAVETARIACKELASDASDVLEPETDGRLAGGRFDALELAAGRGEVLLVGHEPDFSDAVQDVTGGRIRLRKGGLAGIEDRELNVLLRPADLRAIAKSG